MTTIKSQVDDAISTGMLRKYQENKLRMLVSKYYGNKTVKAIFHFISIIMTAFFILPFLINGLEGALYSKGGQLQDVYKFLMFIIALAIAGGLEFLAVQAYSEFIDDRFALKNATNINYEERLKELKVTTAIVITSAAFQLATAFGGIYNTLQYMSQTEMEKMHKKEIVDKYNEVTQVWNILKNKKTAILKGEYTPTKNELLIDNTVEKKALEYEQSLKIAQRNLEEAKNNFESWKAGVLSNKHNYVGKSKQLTPRIRTLIVNRYNKMVLPLQHKVDEISLKISKIKAVKNTMTVNEFVNKIDAQLRKIDKERERIWQELKATKHNKKFEWWVYIIIAIVSIMIFYMQSNLQNKTNSHKDNIMRILDNLYKKINRGTTTTDPFKELEELEKKLMNIDNSKEEEKKEPHWTDYTDDWDDLTNRVFSFMLEYYQTNKNLPSNSIIEKELELTNHAVKKARESIKNSGFYTQNGTKIEPTEIFKKALEAYNTQVAQVA